MACESDMKERRCCVRAVTVRIGLSVVVFLLVAAEVVEPEMRGGFVAMTGRREMGAVGAFVG